MQTQDIDETSKDKKSSFAHLDMQQWSKIIKQWDKTQESQKAYCKRLNLNFNTFAYVKAKLNQKHQLTNKFIPVKIQSHEPLLDVGSSLLFENKSGIKLKISLSVKESTLLNVLKLIGWNHA